jgi:thioredoxin 1
MDSFNTLINSKNPVLVDFFATWCGPCQMLAPILKDVKDTLGDAIKIIKIDVDKNQALMSDRRFQVKGVPTLMLFQNGKMLWRQSGVVPREEIIRAITSLTQ